MAGSRSLPDEGILSTGDIAVCFGHGPALLGAETAALAEAAAAAEVSDPLG